MTQLPPRLRYRESRMWHCLKPISSVDTQPERRQEVVSPPSWNRFAQADLPHWEASPLPVSPLWDLTASTVLPDGTFPKIMAPKGTSRRRGDWFQRVWLFIRTP